MFFGFFFFFVCFFDILLFFLLSSVFGNRKYTDGSIMRKRDKLSACKVFKRIPYCIVRKNNRNIYFFLPNFSTVRTGGGRGGNEKK